MKLLPYAAGPERDDGPPRSAGRTAPGSAGCWAGRVVAARA